MNHNEFEVVLADYASQNWDDFCKWAEGLGFTYAELDSLMEEVYGDDGG